ncbi:MAG: PIG-L family deacetylase [Spirochaetales bacterium]|nr:PIG-L family deacetylase [Spirochaetales bacterium]
MSLLRRALKIAAPLPKLESFSRYLFIGPHPDDIEIGCGATVSKLVSLGKEVSFLICLDGRFGLTNAPEGTLPKDLIEIRRKEAIESANMLGVDDVHFLDMQDGGFYAERDLREAIATRVGIFKPDVMFAPDPDVPNECHIDHLNVGRQSKIVAHFAVNSWIMERYGAASTDVKAIALYMTAKPNSFIGTRGGHVSKQLDSIFKVHLSQFPEGCPEATSITRYIKLRSVFFGMRSRKGKAEGFRVIDSTHMHCLPEEP